MTYHTPHDHPTLRYVCALLLCATLGYVGRWWQEAAVAPCPTAPAAWDAGAEVRP